jgi:hypothetical protein
VQHDAVLATLTLLQPAADAASPSDGGPEQRLPALYPQVLKVTRRAGTGSWPAAWAAAEAESARLQRAVLAESDLDRGRYTLLRAGVGASYAPANAWPPTASPSIGGVAGAALADLPWGWLAAVVAWRCGRRRRAGRPGSASARRRSARRSCCAWARWAASTRWANWPPAWRTS